MLQTDKHIDMLIAILCTLTVGKVKINTTHLYSNLFIFPLFMHYT